jgi:predicted  nucleic acid-binding Zn-ribbon protein
LNQKLKGSCDLLLPFWVIDLQTEEIRILGRDELISAVIGKHERMITDYSSEYDTLKNSSGELDAEIDGLKKHIEEVSEQIGVYEEKKNLFGHNALDELEKLGLETMDRDKIEAGIKSLMSAKIDNAEERKNGYESLQSDVKNISEKDTQALLSKIDDTFEAYQNENTARETAASEKALLVKKESEVSENKRLEWLEKRIKSHQESLEYWKGMK